MGAHQPHLGLGVSDQDVSQDWPSRWTGLVEIKLTFSPLISPLYFKLFNLDIALLLFLYLLCYWPHLIADQYIECVSS